MPIAHMVLWKWKSSATKEQIKLAVETAPKMLAEIPGIIEIESGENFTERSKGFTHGLFVKFTNKEALKGYMAHDLHTQYMKKFLADVEEDVLVLDFEYSEKTNK